MGKKACFLFLAIILLLPWLRPGSAVKAQQVDQTQKTLEHEVSVTLKLIQVYVTDKNGDPVIDLEKDEFEIFDNGKQQNITDFEKYVLSIPVLKAESQAKMEEITQIPKKISRKFFLFFDFAFNNPTGIKTSKKAALHFIDTQLQPTDEVGILSYSSGERLKLNEYLTTNHQRVRSIVDSMGIKKISGAIDEAEREYWHLQEKWREEGELAAAVGQQEIKSQIKQMEEKTTIFDRKYYEIQASNYSLKLADLAKAMRYIPGQKHIIFFSSGIAHSLLYGKADPTPMREGDLTRSVTGGQSRPRGYYEDMIKELAAANCVVYTLNSEALRTTVREDPNMIGGNPFYTDDMTGSRSLQRLAVQTGGKHFDNVNAYEDIMENIQSMTGSYYVLGFYINEKWDGKFHKIKVNINRKDCKIHAQGGYFNPKPFNKFSDLEKRIHLIDLALTEKSKFQIPLTFAMAAFPCFIKGKSHLIIFPEIPGNELQEVLADEVELVSFVFNQEEVVVGYKSEQKNLSAIPKKKMFASYAHILPPGNYQCRMVIRNLKTGRAAVATISTSIPVNPDPGLQIYTPLLLVPQRDTLFTKGKASVFPFDTNVFCPLVGEMAPGTAQFFALVSCAATGISNPQINLTAKLKNYSSEEEIPLSLAYLDRTQSQDTHIFLVRIRAHKLLKPGNYLLRLSAQDSEVQSGAQVEHAFQVKAAK